MKCKFSEVALFNPTERIKKGTLSKKVPMEKLQPFYRDIPSFEVTKFKGGTKFRNGDTIMARITPCLENGKTAKINILEDGEVGFGSTEYIVFRAVDGIVDEDYLYYLVCSPIVRDIAIKSMVGSSGRQRVQIDVIKDIELNLPSLDEQVKIGSLLKFLDDKIFLNNKINNNLEQQAQAMFDDFFLNREELPEGWSKGSLIDIADYLNGLAMQKYRPTNGEQGIPVLKIKELRQGMCDDSSELCSPNIKPEYIVSNGDVIFSWSGSLLVDFWCGGTCGLNQHLFKVTSSKYDKWFYYAWTKHHLAKFITLASAMATTMGHIKRGELANSEVLIPSIDDYSYIGGLLQPMYDMIIANREENVSLANLRDELLPQLMSGELDVSSIDL
ncbi:MAG: restriction endonuclease subunit S [Peptostreptococcus anaerobius]|uniref:restriction endonuclease subunit S n=2 Tax=Peptostreptococcus anaerobius TaxID=1261 RepID=UPI002904F7D4|nr:restriction endonuclease subunit S [Peptostreptococcus anaerobius]MDU0964048.1 restriction endonuclease subunit S [Peptostreptococcus anaerobius]MDU0997778.1 restriction endonuclease subunit S [Peptostreptococcus anaerobius]